jgi:integrase
MSKTPKLCKQGNLAYVRIHGQKIYLGTHGTPEARREYHRVIAEYHANASAPPKNSRHILTIDELCLRFLEDRKVDLAPKQLEHYKSLIEIILSQYSGLSANEFSPNKLRTLRAEFVKYGYVRQQCNKRASLVRTIFKWGVSHELIPADIWDALRSLEPLRKGQTKAPEGKRRKAIPKEFIERTLKELSPTIATMVRVHLATAARPSEICEMKIEYIDRNHPDLWVVRPPEHKNDWREEFEDRILYLAKPEIDLIAPIIGERTEGYVFRPQDAVRENKAKKWEQAKRKKKTPSRLQRDKERAKRPKQQLTEYYQAPAYRRAIERACQRAGVPHWFPYGLRHTDVTNVGLEHGIEAAQHVAGHKDLRTTLNYFHGEDVVAKNVALKRNEQYGASDVNAPNMGIRQGTQGESVVSTAKAVDDAA